MDSKGRVKRRPMAGDHPLKMLKGYLCIVDTKQEEHFKEQTTFEV